MDAILTRVGVSDAQLRSHCVEAIQDELGKTDAQLQAALGALSRALEVVEASRELLKAPLALADSLPSVAESLSSIANCGNEIAPMARKLRRVVSSSRTVAGRGDESSSSTEDDEDLPFFSVKEEPDAAEGDAAQLESNEQAGSLPEESVKSESHSTARASDESSRTRHRRRERTSRRLRSSRVRTSGALRSGEADGERRSSGRKRKAPDRYLTPLPYLERKKVSKKELLEDRVALQRHGKLGKEVRSCLLAVQDGDVPNIVKKLQVTCRALVGVKDGGGDITPFMEDIEAALGVAVSEIDKYEGRLVRNDLRSILLLLESLPREFHETGKLRRSIAAKFVTPADEVVIIHERLESILVEVREWCGGDVDYSVSMFEERLQYIKETLEASSYEGGYEPRWDKTIAELLFRLGCCLNVFETGWAQDRRYDTIRSLLFDMKSADRSKRKA